MRTFLLWRKPADETGGPPVSEVADRLVDLLDPILATPPRVRTIETADVSLVFAEQPVRGWRAQLFETDGERWALAVDYPFGAGGLLELARRLEDSPNAALETLAPPFAVVWGRHGDPAVHVQNDALGQAQLFEYDDGRLFAVTNRITALTALGVPLVPVARQWAVRATLGWFPLELTGYRNLRFVQPGTRLTLRRDRVVRTVSDMLRRWVAGEPLREADCLEIARSSLVQAVEAAAPLWEKPRVGLSGGRDTRAVVAVLRSLGIDFSARVRGARERPDVVVAQRLAEVAGLPLRVRTTAGLPAEDADGCRRSISLALRWQAGYMATSKHKTFLSRQPGFDGGVVNVMGQHGEIGRSYYARMIRGSASAAEEYESLLLRALLAKLPSFLRPELREYVRETIRTACHQADRYELAGRRRLDFFYLYERTRRWASGSLNSQDGIVFAPFLNPGFVRAVFAAPSSADPNRFHRYIVERHAPDWLDVPYVDELPRRRVDSTDDTADWRKPRGNHHYDAKLYWRRVGSPIIEEALAEQGWWTEIFDPSSVRSTWQEAADELAIAYLLPEAVAATPRAAVARRGPAPAPTPP